jgi:hypothetical protein
LSSSNLRPFFPFSWAPPLLFYTYFHCSYMYCYYNYSQTLCMSYPNLIKFPCFMNMIDLTLREGFGVKEGSKIGWKQGDFR